MGESPRESAAAASQQRISGMMGSYSGGVNSATSRFGSMSPMIDKAIADMSQMWNNQIAGVRGQSGQQLVQSGVAPGAPIQSAYLGILAPALAEVAGNRGKMEASKVDLLNSLFTQQDRAILGLTQSEQGAISQMDDSTWLGDVGSVVGSLGQVASGLWGPTGLLTALGAGSTFADMFKKTPDTSTMTSPRMGV